MFTLEMLSLPSAQLLTETLIHFVWQGFVIASIVLLVLHALTSSNARYVAAVCGLFAMSICPPATYVLLNQKDVTTSSNATAPIDFREEDQQFTSFAAPTTWPTEIEAAGTYSSLQPYLLAIWLSGVLVFSMKLALAACSIQWLQLGRRPISRDFAARFGRLAHGLGQTAHRTVFVSNKVHDALVVGFLRPAVLLPASWLSELPADVIEAIVAHELAHIRRWDLWVNLWQRGVETLVFYHPAVWWLSRRVRVEREMCCDELAVAATGNRLVYANALELAARRRIAARQPALAAALRGESQMSLLRRVQNVLGVGPKYQRAGWLPLLLLATVCCIAFVTISTGGFDSASMVAFADDDDNEGNRQEARRDRDRDDDERERDGTARERDRNVNREVRREGERRDGARERDGDRGRPDPERRERDGDRAHAERDRDGARRPPSTRHRPENSREASILQMLMELRREVAGLREEVRALRERAGSQPRPPRGREAEERNRTSRPERRSDSEAARHRAEDERAAASARSDTRRQLAQGQRDRNEAERRIAEEVERRVREALERNRSKQGHNGSRSETNRDAGTRR